MIEREEPEYEQAREKEKSEGSKGETDAAAADGAEPQEER